MNAMKSIAVAYTLLEKVQQHLQDALVEMTQDQLEKHGVRKPEELVAPPEPLNPSVTDLVFDRTMLGRPTPAEYAERPAVVVPEPPGEIPKKGPAARSASNFAYQVVFPLFQDFDGELTVQQLRDGSEPKVLESEKQVVRRRAGNRGNYREIPLWHQTLNNAILHLLKAGVIDHGTSRGAYEITKKGALS